MEGRLIRDHFAPSKSAYRDVIALQKYMALGLVASFVVISPMAVIYAKPAATPVAVFGVFAACLCPINNFVVMNIDTWLGLETSASCVEGVDCWSVFSTALVYKSVAR